VEGVNTILQLVSFIKPARFLTSWRISYEHRSATSLVTGGVTKHRTGPKHRSVAAID